ncbi:conserved hypothetical protein [Stutzerimonas stutzeri A1501]|uniref:Uncharacterized protein n=1 Tax=Stutzerimonas stutzeri (strain A1501) TaxID=379731 RepID=A4VRE4_STUS1|nr:conserved hypothetical protein [Stutzerimonas stutzeri A1501]
MLLGDDRRWPGIGLEPCAGAVLAAANAMKNGKNEEKA